MRKNKTKYQFENGATSIFVVLFTTILLGVIAIGFAQIMLRDRQQAINNDLGKSANDSALAGIEDAKLALIKCLDDPSAVGCAQLDNSDCDGVSKVLGNNAGEVKIESNGGGADLNQAYTCVTVERDTPDYLGELPEGYSEVIPLRFKPGENVTHLRISWFTAGNVGTGGDAGNIAYSDNTDLPVNGPTGGWVNRPSLMRAQLIQTDSQFSVEDLRRDGYNLGASYNPRTDRATVFMYPQSISTNTRVSGTVLTNSAQQNPNFAEAPYPVKCETNLNSNSYACSVGVQLPNPINGGARNPNTLFLRLSAYYTGSDFKVEGCEGWCSPTNDNVKKFYGVQPEIDSTGRANNIFRRVISRVTFNNGDFLYPDFELELGPSNAAGSNEICKDFTITDNADDGIYNCQ